MVYLCVRKHKYKRLSMEIERIYDLWSLVSGEMSQWSHNATLQETKEL